MPEERSTNDRLDRMDHRFDQMDHRFDQMDHRLDRMDRRFDQIDQRFEAVDSRFEKVDQRFDRLEAKMDETNRHMRVLHEEVLDRIAALAPDFGPIRREFTAADNELREQINQRLNPLEAWVRTRKDDGSSH
jgi:archaellum component FlaC